MSEGRTKEQLQTELNRQALVDLGKRLADLEKKFWDLENEANDLKYFSNSALETAKRLQILVKEIVDDFGHKSALEDDQK